MTRPQQSSKNPFFLEIMLLAANDATQGETKTAASTATETTGTKTTPVSFYTNLLSRPEHISSTVFAKSSRLSKEEIQRNKYNHHGDSATCPPCLHEQCSNWNLGVCADCGADLGPQRLAEEEQRGKRNEIKDHLPLVDFVVNSENVRVTHATLGKGMLQELRGVLAVIIFDCDPSARRVVLPCSAVEELRHHLEVHHATQSHRRGIRLDALLAFAHDHDCMEWPVKTVVRDIIIPATRETMCRYADLPEFQGMFGKATVFMSHCWGGRFGDLVGAACHGARMDRIVWIDIFAVRQWPRNALDLNFRDVIERCEAMVVSTSPVEGLIQRVVVEDRKQVPFLASKQFSLAAKKLMPFCRLWCVVEVAAGVARSKNIVVKCGRVVRRKDGKLEYVTGQDGSETMGIVAFMIDVVSSECAVPADYVREMDIIRETEGGVENVNAVVSGVVLGAWASIKSNVLEIDAAACGEFESLLELRMPSLSTGAERRRAGKMLRAACSGGRAEIVRVLLDQWLLQKETSETKEKFMTTEELKKWKKREKKKRQRAKKKKKNRSEEGDGEEGERRRREREEWLCRLVDEKLIVVYAAEGGHLEVVEMLLERVQGVDVNMTSERVHGATALHEACKYGHEEVVRLLLDSSGIAINQANTDTGSTPLFTACEQGHAPVVELLLASSGIAVNQATTTGATPLNVACEKGHAPVVELLLTSSGIDVNQAVTLNGRTLNPLFLACQNGHAPVVELLFASSRIDVNQVNTGCSPLFIACQQGHAPVVKLLLTLSKFDVNQGGINGTPPLFMACQYGHTPVVELLLASSEIDINKSLDDGQSPLFAAAESGHVALVTLLIKAGANLNARVIDPSPIDPGASGLTPLDISLKNGHENVVQLLVDAGGQ